MKLILLDETDVARYNGEVERVDVTLQMVCDPGFLFGCAMGHGGAFLILVTPEDLKVGKSQSPTKGTFA